jgi:hypothetical protein
MPGKSFWKSKGFWGQVISVGALFLPQPAGVAIGVIGNMLGLYGRAVATQPLTLTDNGKPAAGK